MKIPMPARNWLIAGLTVASLQSAAIGWMVWDRIQLLRHGREITLPVVPVDPRSLFRGDYVILSYEAQRLPASLITDELDKARPPYFYVTLAKSGDTWKPVATSLKPVPQTADRITLKAKPQYGYWPNLRPQASRTPPPQNEAIMQLKYGIEAYFVAEGQGGSIEQTARDKKLAALIAVDAKGNAAIKGLVVDGKLQYEEPLL